MMKSNKPLNLQATQKQKKHHPIGTIRHKKKPLLKQQNRQIVNHVGDVSAVIPLISPTRPNATATTSTTLLTTSSGPSSSQIPSHSPERDLTVVTKSTPSLATKLNAVIKRVKRSTRIHIRHHHYHHHHRHRNNNQHPKTQHTINQHPVTTSGSRESSPFDVSFTLEGSKLMTTLLRAQPRSVGNHLDGQSAEAVHITTAQTISQFFHSLSATLFPQKDVVNSSYNNTSITSVVIPKPLDDDVDDHDETKTAHSTHILSLKKKKALFSTTFRQSLVTHSHSSPQSTTTPNPLSRDSSSLELLPKKQPLGQLYQVGAVIEGFNVETAEVYPSLSLAVYTFTHQRSQAQFVHVERDDTDNAFCVGFRTMPQDDTGVAHILEHTVLCGSKKYPVRDPFFLMTRRSLSTFMNAMTRAEATYYPFSTQNEQDFQNLLDVYLDSVFFPLIRKLDFKQEGHRIEPLGLFGDDDDDDHENDDHESAEEEGDKDSTMQTESEEAHSGEHEQGKEEVGSTIIPQKFEFKGVVFNEMKGDMSDPRSWLFGRISRHLHPTAIYRNNSGGDPISIPNLTHEQLVQFHAKHYHPGNAIFMTYGHRRPVLSAVNATINAKLDELKAQYPQDCESSSYGDKDFAPSITPHSAVDMVRNTKRYSKPFTMVEPGPTASLEDKERPYKASMTWLCRDSVITDITSPSLLDFDSFNIEEIETTIDFTRIRDEGVEYQPNADPNSTDDDGLIAPDRIINDSIVIDKIMASAQEPVIKRSHLSSTTSHRQWYDNQLEAEVIAGQALFKTKIEDLKIKHNLTGPDADEQVKELIQTDFPELLSLIPRPKQMKHYGTSDHELISLIQRIKKLPKSEQDSLNLQFEQTALSFLSSLVFDNVYSPLYTLLTDPALGTSSSPTTGVDTWEHTPSFSMGFNGIKRGQVDMVLGKLFTALEDIAATGSGINPSTLDALLHQSELSLKDHKKSFGVNMLQRLISPFAHNQSIQHGYQIIDLLPLFRHVIETSGSLYFRTLIKHHILSNPHRLTYIMTPDHNLSAKLKADEDNLLAQKTAGWTDEDKVRCEVEARELKAHQDAEVDDSSLPSLKVSNIDPSMTKYRFTTFPMGGQVQIPVPITLPNGQEYDLGTDFVDFYSPQQIRSQYRNLHHSFDQTNQPYPIDLTSGPDRMTCSSITEDGINPINTDNNNDDVHNDNTTIIIPKQYNPILARPVTFNVQPTNGIVVIRALINDVGSRFTPYQLSLIPFLNLIFGHIGAGGRDYKEHSHTIEQTASDFSIQIVTDDIRIVDENGKETFKNTLQASIKGKCLARNVEKMCALLVDSLTTPNYTEHVYNTLAQYSGGLQSAVEENGPRFAMMDAQARMPDFPHGQKHNMIHGLPHVQATTALFKQIAADLQHYQSEEQDQDEQLGEPSSSTIKKSTSRQSPLMMRLANDIAEAMRCLLVGPATNQFSPARPLPLSPSSAQSNQGDMAPTSIGNANYFGPTNFDNLSPTSPSINLSSSHHPHHDEQKVNYAPHTHDPVYPNPHVKIQEQFPLTFPFGFDRILVTCDQNTLSNPQTKTQLITGVNHLINGVYHCQPTAYQPENSLLPVTSTQSEGKDGIDTTSITPSTAPQPQTISTKTPKELHQTHNGFTNQPSGIKIKPLSDSRNKFITPSGQILDLGSSGPPVSTAAEFIQTYTPPPTPIRKFNYISAPVQVNSVVYSEKTQVTHNHADFGVMQVLSELVNEGFLHTEIREKGGAYGRFASHDRNGIFSLGSIRDPQCTRTVEVFKRSLLWLSNVDSGSVEEEGNHSENSIEENDNGIQKETSITTTTTSTDTTDTNPPTATSGFNYTQQQLDEAKIALFANIDAPQSAGNRGLSPWLRNADHSHREALRAAILNTTLNDIQRCARSYLNFDNAFISIVGNKEKVPTDILESSNDNNGSWSLTILDIEVDPNAVQEGSSEGDDE